MSYKIHNWLVNATNSESTGSLIGLNFPVSPVVENLVVPIWEDERTSHFSPPAGGRNLTAAGEGISAKIPDGFRRPLPSSMRDASA